ncbi:MAG: UDP-N-acetylglucosamine 1-carboxyvinyltransferase [Clostridia bacterium]|nr:UDP-N-acetylglucosamine 1-carboxyvinyltransferase [Clostridia bacterium]MEE1184682.1 UDP-N-acetylglucosamine 1-carboxyvinyltransferase [Acutalibacteraceae bacterium]
MEKFVISGGKPLKGTVHISGAKNAAVAVLPAVLLSDEPCTIENLPNISDVSTILQTMSALGAKVKLINKSTVEIDPRNVRSYVVTKQMAEGMRASSYFMGALLGRMKHSRVAPPGGCDFGVRPIDQHIKGFEALGAKVTIENGMVDAKADELRGSSIYLDVVSVGATINIMLAAVKVKGLTVIENAAREPHIVDLANFLNSMGADIMGAGTGMIKIRGVDYLKGADYSIIPDQIEAGTYMVAAAATMGDVLINNVTPKHLESIAAKLREMGALVEEFEEAVRVKMSSRPRKCNVKTMPHPGFPTDMQPQIATILAVAEGTSIVTEGVWDSRFRYVEQLTLMGADIQVDGKMAVITGVDALSPAPVKAVDLRAGAAMLIAGMMAEGVTEIEEIDHIDRGYEEVVEKFTALGADIKRVYYDENAGALKRA